MWGETPSPRPPGLIGNTLQTPVENIRFCGLVRRGKWSNVQGAERLVRGDAGVAAPLPPVPFARADRKSYRDLEMASFERENR